MGEDWSKAVWDGTGVASAVPSGSGHLQFTLYMGVCVLQLTYSADSNWQNDYSKGFDSWTCCFAVTGFAVDWTVSTVAVVVTVPRIRLMQKLWNKEKNKEMYRGTCSPFDNDKFSQRQQLIKFYCPLKPFRCFNGNAVPKFVTAQNLL